VNAVEGRPAVAVVIPVRNRPHEIVECVRSLAALDYPRDLVEVIVVDDASTDDTAGAVRALALPGVRVLAGAEHSGQSACRNAGASDANADIVAFIDSDCTADPGWLAELTSDFADPTVVAVGGGVRAKDPETWIERYEAACSPLDKGPVPAEVVPGSGIDSLASCNLVVRRRAFLDAGGFDAGLAFGEDVDLVWRLRRLGGRVLYRPSGAVEHDYRSTFGAFFRRRVDYTIAQGMFLRRYPRNGGVFDLPAGLLIGAAIAIAGIASGHPALAALGAIAPASDAIVSGRGGGGLRGGILRVVTSYAAALYRVVSRAGKYWALPAAVAGAVLALVASPAWSWLVVGALATMGIPAIVEWVRKRPGLDPARFAAAVLADSVAVNAGTVWGCVVHRTLRPLSVRFAFHATSASMPPSRRPIAAPGTSGAPAGGAR